MMRRFLVPIVLLALAACAQAPVPDDVGDLAPTLTFPGLIYYVGDPSNFANPERGFYRHQGDCDKDPFNVATLRDEYRGKQKITLVMCIFYLNKTPDSPPNADAAHLNDAAQVDFFQKQAAVVRAAGLKMILRFAYTKKGFTTGSDGKVIPPPGDDVPLSRVQEHLAMFTSALRDYSDVIAVVQSGFVGTWGEGYYTQNFGNNGNPTDPNNPKSNWPNWDKRRAVVDGLRQILPYHMVQVRTPRMKREMYFRDPDGITDAGDIVPVSPADAYSFKPQARVGYANDCFLYSDDDNGDSDQGTFSSNAQELSIEKADLALDTKYVAMGGETCWETTAVQGDPPVPVPLSERAKCPAILDPAPPETTKNEMKKFHFSYLNYDYSKDVINHWIQNGCISKIKTDLGYRFSLYQSFFVDPVKQGAEMFTFIYIFNTGWATPFNYRPVYLVMRPRGAGKEFSFKLNTDPRKWQTYGRIAQSVRIPSDMPPGSYKLYLNFPDPWFRLATGVNKAAYAIRLANSRCASPANCFWTPEGIFSETTGYNDLLRTITVEKK